MKRTTTLFTLCLTTALSTFATDHTIVTQGLTYMPATLTVAVGDNVTIVATGNHPTTQVSQATWDANEATPLADGFGTNSAEFTFAIESTETIFYVCDNHIGAGMKGLIMVEPSSVEELSQSIAIDLGAMPIENGLLNYTIAPTSESLGSIELISLNGKRVAQQTISDLRGTLALRAVRGQYIVLVRDRRGGILYRESVSVR